MLSTKNLVKALQAKAKSIQGVLQLISCDIKIHAEFFEAKKAAMAKSALVHVQTPSVRANGNIANQSKAIKRLQAANMHLHPGLKITKLAKREKIYSTLHIEATTAAIAN